MNVSEVSELLRRLFVNYPNAYSRLDARERTALRDDWATKLADQRAELIFRAYTAYGRSSESKWPPQPGQLIEIAERLSGSMDADGAWATVLAVASSRDFSREPWEAYNRLDPRIRRAIGYQAMIDVSLMQERELERARLRFVSDYQSDEAGGKAALPTPTAPEPVEFSGTVEQRLCGMADGAEDALERAIERMERRYGFDREERARARAPKPGRRRRGTGQKAKDAQDWELIRRKRLEEIRRQM